MATSQVPQECSEKNKQRITSNERGYGSSSFLSSQGRLTSATIAMEQQAVFPETTTVMYPTKRYLTFQDLLEHHPDKGGVCIAICCTKPKNGPEIHESTSLDCMRKCIEDDLGYVFATPRTSNTEHELRTLLHNIKSTRFPRSYRWVLFYFFGHGNEESINLSDGDMKRSIIIEELKNIQRDDLVKIVWFECCRLTENTNQSLSTKGCEDLDNFLIINATAFNHRAFCFERGCGILTKYFTETVTKLNEPLCAVMGEVRKAIHDSCTQYKVEIPACEKKVHVPPCEDHVIGSINFLAHSTGLCRVHPENVSASLEHFQATVSWSFDARLVYRVLGFEVDLTPKDSEGDVICKTVNKEDRHVTLQNVLPKAEYVPTVRVVYTDEKKFDCKGSSFVTPDLPMATEIKVVQKRLSPCEAEVSWSYKGEESNLAHFSIIATSTLTNEKIDDDHVNPPKRKTTLKLNMHTSHRIEVVTVYKNGMKLRSQMEFKTAKEDTGKPHFIVNHKTTSSVEVTTSLPDMSDYGEDLQIKMCQIECKSEDESDLKEPVPINDSPSNVTFNELKSGAKYNIRVTVTFNSEDVKYAETESPVEIPLPAHHKFLKSCSRCASHPCSLVAICAVAVLLLITIGLLFAASSKVHKDKTCTAYIILPSDHIECGTSSSVCSTVELKQCPKEGDEPNFGVLNSWRIKAGELNQILYAKQLDPVTDSMDTSSRTYYILKGWDIYEWKGSIIEGYCCITNLNFDDQIAYLYLFVNDTYALEFQDGSGVHHQLWSEQLNLPPNKTSCFHKWGRNAPYRVEHNSNHFFGVDLPANVKLVSNVTVLQMTPNVSYVYDFEPKWFSKDNHTDISLPGINVFDPNEYLLICGPPILKPSSQYGELQRYQSDASTHVCTCKHPMYNGFFIGGIVLISLVLLCSCYVFVCCCKQRREFYHTCKRKWRGYRSLPMN